MNKPFLYKITPISFFRFLQLHLEYLGHTPGDGPLSCQENRANRCKGKFRLGLTRVTEALTENQFVAELPCAASKARRLVVAESGVEEALPA